MNLYDLRAEETQPNLYRLQQGLLAQWTTNKALSAKQSGEGVMKKIGNGSSAHHKLDQLNQGELNVIANIMIRLEWCQRLKRV